MLPDELMKQLSEMQDFWSSDVAPDSTLEEFVLVNLSGIDSNEYELSEVLSDRVVEMLLKNGQQQLQHEGRSSVRMISNGRVVDMSYLAPMYRALFDRWQARKWIHVAHDWTVTKAVPSS
ncbi:MAG: hypothetical protein JO218_15475 [Burkholderiales bacterium]|nr:hypothetical protein [Burkholderiales bacterium]